MDLDSLKKDATAKNFKNGYNFPISEGLNADRIVAANVEALVELLWRLVGVYIIGGREDEGLRRMSIGAKENQQEVAFSICCQIGYTIDVQVRVTAPMHS